ncbi:DUF2197 domain-containing protein [Psychrobacillus sp. NEAU-3TGS]|uniref:DUF2197 domain-containing protein n=1 Tax=Psychrobacillus sp. NEAU-3TGS TaxID=2995412 RepID=UPI002495B26D|nr:DUF2197 domain-containing protein [Psychrobacillus sp. NEAU-3TGS]MDI2587061.1 DUF2197 domain-containing protein [Psychrobacillus sp. NEAU-3TGS]
MFYYEIVCCSCRQKFRVYEGSLKYKLYKERTNKVFHCEDCNSKIRMDAIKNFFRYLN